jgi:hypothetical protein
MAASQEGLSSIQLVTYTFVLFRIIILYTEFCEGFRASEITV